MTSAALPTGQAGSRNRTESPPPASNRPSARRLVLVPATGRGDELVRRYRLARLRLETREVRAEDRFTHLKHSHD